MRGMACSLVDKDEYVRTAHHPMVMHVDMIIRHTFTTLTMKHTMFTLNAVDGEKDECKLYVVLMETRLSVLCTSSAGEMTECIV